MVSVVVKANKILTFIILTIVFCSIGLISVFVFKPKQNLNPEDYLKSLGYEIEFIDEKQVNIPKEFGEGLEKYNNFQKSQGFNLKKYRGKSCVQKQYYVTTKKTKSKKYIANVLTYENKLIGGDIHSQYYEQKMLKLKGLK